MTVSLGSGFDKLIEENETLPEIKDILFSSNIYIPLISIILIFLIAFFMRKKFIK